MRIFGFILMLTLGLANLTLKRRLPPINVTGGHFNLRAFKSAPYTFYCISSFFTFLGLYTGAFVIITSLYVYVYTLLQS